MDYHLNSKLSTIAFKFEELERELKEVQKMGVWNEILSHYNGHPLVNLDDYIKDREWELAKNAVPLEIDKNSLECFKTLIGKTIISITETLDTGCLKLADGRVMILEYLNHGEEKSELFIIEGRDEDILGYPVKSVDITFDKSKNIDNEDLYWTYLDVTTEKGSVSFKFVGDPYRLYTIDVYYEED